MLFRRQLGFGLLVGILSATALAGEARLERVNVFGVDRRVAVSAPLAKPWHWLGRVLQLAGDGRILETCTGARVAPRLVLTAAHCVGLSNGQLSTQVRTVFEPATPRITAGHPPRSYAAVTAWAGEWRHESDSRQGDWAILLLENGAYELPDDEYPEIAAERPRLGSWIVSAGYSVDFLSGTVLSSDPACSVRALMSDGVFHHDCAVSAGASGGPLFEVSGLPGAPRYRIVGVHNAHKSRGTRGLKLEKYDGNFANLAASASNFVSLLREIRQTLPPRPPPLLPVGGDKTVPPADSRQPEKTT